MHNHISSLLVLPASLDLVYDLQGFDKLLPSITDNPEELLEECCSLHSYVRMLPFWKAWDGTLLFSQLLPLLLSIFVVATGIGMAAYRWRIVGLIPVFILIGYSISNAVIRNSGWRFILPVDWIALLYYAIGIVQISAWALTYFANRLVPRAGIGLSEEMRVTEKSDRYLIGKAGAILVGFTLIAAAMPIVERVIPYRYAGTDVHAVLDDLVQSGTIQKAEIRPETVQTLIDQADRYLTIGQGMYPRFFEANQGENGTGSPDVIPTSDNRLIFYLANTNRDIIAIPMSEPPETFPNSSNVLVLGCQMDRYILAEMVVILGDSPSVLTRTPDSLLRCPDPENNGL
jgi:hypothetical protein